MTVKLIHFPGDNVRDIPAMLRRVAQNIEDGLFGEVTAASLVTHAAPDKGVHRIEVFGFGDANADRATVLLDAGKRLLVDTIVGYNQS